MASKPIALKTVHVDEDEEDDSAEDQAEVDHTAEDAKVETLLRAHDDKLIKNKALLKGKLAMQVEERGANFSIGEKQLLSLARAILNQNKIILMDEVTANIDYITDKLIQRTIRTSPLLANNTIITIAHRLRTIADYDRIIVMNAGQIVEDNTPYNLLQTEGSLFRYDY